MRLTWLRFRREFASDWLSFQNESTRRGLAVGTIYTIAALAAHAIEHGDALSVAENLRDEAIEFAVAADMEQAQRLKTRAMARRGTKQAQEVTA